MSYLLIWLLVCFSNTHLNLCPCPCTPRCTNALHTLVSHDPQSLQTLIQEYTIHQTLILVFVVAVALYFNSQNTRACHPRTTMPVTNHPLHYLSILDDHFWKQKLLFIQTIELCPYRIDSLYIFKITNTLWIDRKIDIGKLHGFSLLKCTTFIDNLFADRICTHEQRLECIMKSATSYQFRIDKLYMLNPICIEQCSVNHQQI